MKNNYAGFTLIEILIALSIFAVIAVLATLSLRTLLHTYEKIQKVDERLREVMTAITIMQRDISQMVDRPVADTSGSELAALQIPDRTQFEFTRTGLSNPFHTMTRSQLQRVAYSYSDHALYRIAWEVLDRAPHSQAQKKMLLSGVNSFTLFYVNAEGQLTAVWSTTTAHTEFPRAIIVSFNLAGLGDITQIFPIARSGYAS
jgi:general secretion pathway protein J